jgi:hypothetical protein
MDELCRRHHVLFDDQGIVRVPFLVKGRLVVPPEINRSEIEAAFAGQPPQTAHARVREAQVIRQRVVDRTTLRYTSDYVYQVMPPVNPRELIETDIDKLAGGLYALPVPETFRYLESVSHTLEKNTAVIEGIRELFRRTSELPDLYLDGDFAALANGLSLSLAESLIDNELSIWHIPGRRFLEGWVEVPADIIPGLVPLLAQSLPGAASALPTPSAKACLRAMPTRQLHIAAGNVPEIPIVSAVRMVLTKSAGVVKCPAEATLPGAMLAVAAVAAEPDHPITQNLSIVYWPGGDESVENELFMPGAFDRIAVWGSPETIQSVQSRAAFTKTLYFNPRYGVSLIGHEAFASDLAPVVFAAAMDVMIYNQQACTSSHVQYVEGTEEQVRAYAERLVAMLNQWDQLTPTFIPPATRGQLKQLRRGKYARAQWLTNVQADEFTSGVVIMPGEFDILEHPMCRLAVIRRVDSLSAALPYLHAGVSMAGVYPEERRLALRDSIAARGVSSVLPLGQCGSVFAGMPHDGMMVLNQLVDWKVA